MEFSLYRLVIGHCILHQKDEIKQKKINSEATTEGRVKGLAARLAIHASR